MKTLILVFSLLVTTTLAAQTIKIDTFKTYQVSVLVIGKGEKIDYIIDNRSVTYKVYKKVMAKLNKSNQITRKGKFYYNKSYNLKDVLLSEGHCFNECMIGYHKTYHLNGKVASEGFYLEPNFEYKELPNSFCSLREGLWKFYDKEGKVIKETVYKNGKIIDDKEIN